MAEELLDGVLSERDEMAEAEVEAPETLARRGAFAAAGAERS